MAIIGVLAAAAMGGLSTMSKSTARAEGLSKLRDIGLAMNSYAMDYEGYLPGPLKQGQSPVPASSGHLVNYVKPYMFPDEPLGYKSVQPGFVSKAWMKWFRASGLASAVVYYVNVTIPDPANPGTYYFPVGNVGTQSKNNRSVTNPNLWKANIPSSRTPLMWDWFGTDGSSAPYGQIQSGINVTYLDWHVENTTDVDRLPGSVYKPKGW